MRRVITSSLALAVLAFFAPAGAVPSPVIATVQTTYVPGDDAYPITLEVPQGTSLTYLNLDPTPAGTHSVTAHGVRSDDPTFFDSGVIDFGGIAEVAGVADLPPGSYAFYCVPHPGMRGTLTIT